MFAPSSDIFRKYTDGETFAKIRGYGTVAEMWKHCAAEYGGRTAVEDNGSVYSYEQLDRDVAAFRGLLAGEGMIGILVENSYDFVKVFLAAATAGRPAVIMPPQLPAEAVLGITAGFGLKALAVSPALSAKTAPAAERIPGIKIVSSADRGEPVPAADVKPGAPCAVMFTGGTTGKSKAAILSNEAVMQGTVNGCYGYRDVFFQRYLLVLPFSHVFGLIRNLMTSLYTGSALFICRDNKNMFRDIAVFRPTVMVMVPALAEMALTLSRKFGRNMLGPDLKYIICGAAAVPPYLIGEYAKEGISLFPGYGLTESANLVSGNPECATKPESVGIPYPGQELKLENGELWIRGKNIMTGYAGGIPSFTEDGWFRTGDLARFDEEGFLYITGRIKEIIVLPNGENVSPAEVEAHFSALDCVQDCELYEDTSDNGTRILVLEVLPRMTELGKIPEAERGAYLTGKINEVNATLPGYQRFSRLIIRDADFPRSPSMKILRHARAL